MTDIPGFQLSGSAPQNYELYSQFMVDPFIDEMIRRANLEPGSAVLDVACGTGRLARAVHNLLGGRCDVHGLDLNPGMLETAKALSANAGGDEISWHEASAEEMPLPDDQFDAVLCSFGIMFFSDLTKGLGEMVRVAKPGGTIACAFFAGPLERSPYMKVQAMRLDPMLEAGVLALAHGAFRIEAEQVAAILTELGVTNVAADTLEPIAELPAAREYLPVHIGGLPYSAEFQALPDQTKEQLYQQVTHDLASYTTAGGTIKVPFAGHVVSATAP